MTFPEVTMFQQRRGKCATCGKTTNHRVWVSQTINPFNKLPCGLPKSEADIRAELRVELEEKCKRPLKCQNCNPHR